MTSSAIFDNYENASKRPDDKCLCILLERMAKQYSSLKRDAEKAGMTEFYDAYCADTVEGQVTKLSHEIFRRQVGSVA